MAYSRTPLGEIVKKINDSTGVCEELVDSNGASLSSVFLTPPQVASTQALVSPDGNVLVHPKTYFQGAAGGHAVADGRFFDVAAGNHGVFGANLSRAQAWANLGSGYISTIDPVVSFTDSVIRIPGPNFDYAGGESLLIFWAGQVTPDADVTIMGTSFGSTASGVRVRAKSTGRLDFAVYQAGGANAFSSATTDTAAGKPFVAGETHSFGIWLNGNTRTHAVLVDEVVNVAETSFGAGATIDCLTTNTWNIGAGSASPGGTEGIATNTAALLLMRWGPTDTLPTLAKITAAMQQWRASPRRTILPGAL
jgi:hypothetical protein